MNVRRAVKGLATVVLAVAVCGAAAVRAVEGAAPDPILSALAEKPLAVIRMSSPTAAAEALWSTRLGRQARNELAVTGATTAWQGAVQLAAGVLTDLSAADVERLMSREVALVIFRPGPQDREPPVVLALDVGDDAALVERTLREQAVPRMQAANPRLTVATRQTEAGVLARFSEAGQEKGCLLLTDRLLVAGLEAAVIRVNPAVAGGGRLIEDAAPEGIVSSYLDVQHFWDVNMRGMREGERRGLEGSGLPAVHALWGATSVQGDGFRDVVTARLTADSAGLLPALAAVEPGEVRAARAVPADYSCLLSCRIGSGETLYAMLEDVLRHNEGEAGVEGLRAGLDGIDQAFSVNVQWELLPAIGGEVFLALHLPDADALDSGRQPRFRDFRPLFGFALRDKEALPELAERFGGSLQAQQMGWQVVTEKHAGTQVHTISNMAGPAQFAFAVIGDMCVVALDTSVVLAAADAAADGRTLAADPAYGAVNGALPRALNAFLYLDTGPLREVLLSRIAQKTPERKRPFLGLVRRLVPALGSYGAAALRDGDVIRLEGVGDAPVLFSLAGLASVGSAADLCEQTIRAHRAQPLPQ